MSFFITLAIFINRHFSFYFITNRNHFGMEFCRHRYFISFDVLFYYYFYFIYYCLILMLYLFFSLLVSSLVSSRLSSLVSLLSLVWTTTSGVQVLHCYWYCIQVCGQLARIILARLCTVFVHCRRRSECSVRILFVYKLLELTYKNSMDVW